MPMSWDRGSQLTITSVLVSQVDCGDHADGVRHQIRVRDLYRFRAAG